MTYEEIVDFVKNNVKKTVSDKKEHLAVEFDIYGEGEGAFYIEANGGKVFVEPYEYYDRDAKVIITADELVRIAKGEKTVTDSIEDGILMTEGDFSAATKLLKLVTDVKKAAKPAPKATQKKAKKTTTAKKEKAVKEAAPKKEKKAALKTVATPAAKVEKKPAQPAAAAKSAVVSTQAGKTTKTTK